ncbi:hypothetical protein OG562_17830 [Streptomyces sp. NBC_01275]|uniref:hypothetical protein n=1 Tax=Streptomyces sp. NBC_01275 TaxID=2903807 RepID=UPI00225BE891|nr:hypothetical protein [Streptomyces sp. NBC_01275]MCX4762805.1 hypothetical protein [Streptomyces sp. NBC_01275]
MTTASRSCPALKLAGSMTPARRADADRMETEVFDLAGSPKREFETAFDKAGIS